MITRDFSFVILTYNEELHLPRLLSSIENLGAPTYILDSGSTDDTINICKTHHIKYRSHPFENHPDQWDLALKIFEIKTPWIIGLDADQIISPELNLMLQAFKNEDYPHIDGIYFNRKNIFKGKWIRYGGYYPKYLLKMFRQKIGYSDLTETSDHKFQVNGKTTIWKNGHLLEENLKDNNISFWIQKHDKYSTLIAQQETEAYIKLPKKSIPPKFLGTPNEHNAWLKVRWKKMPLYLRPCLYFGYRFFFRLGFLDGKNGIIYHFLQAFWFRLIIDIKIEEKQYPGSNKPNNNMSLRFLISFIGIFIFIYGFNLSYIGITTPGRLYSSFLDQHFNYIRGWRHFYISTTAKILEITGYSAEITPTTLKVKNHSGFRLIYSCLGYGVMSFFTAFVLAFPKPIYSRLMFLFTGLIFIHILNLSRLILIAIFYKPKIIICGLNHHQVFNYLLYAILLTMIYLWLNTNKDE